MVKERDQGLAIDGSKVTFGEFAMEYIDMLEAADSVCREYQKIQRRQLEVFCSYIGAMRLRDVTPQVVEATLAAIKKDKTEEYGSFKNATLKHYRTTLRQVMKKAFVYDFVPCNPCDKVEPTVGEPVDRKSLSADGVSSLLRAVDEREAEMYERIKVIDANRKALWRDHIERVSLHYVATISYTMIVRIAIATGMRRSEIIGLLWESVDIEERRIEVCRVKVTVGGLKKTKTKASMRTISIDEKTARHLEVWKKAQAVELRKIGVVQTEETPVCCNSYGNLMSSVCFSDWFRVFREAAGFPNLKFHELRHTQSTLLLGNGADVKTVQKRLGHARCSTTVDIYAHTLPGNDEKAAALIGCICEKGSGFLGIGK